MDLDQVRSLSIADQQVFLLGRIASETTRMDAALRGLHAALRGERDVSAFLDAPDYVSTTSRQCRGFLRENTDLDDETRSAVAGALTATDKAYKLRNRYFHDFLRAAGPDRWELAPMTRGEPTSLDGRPDAMPVSFEDMVTLVTDLVAATWRLRGCIIYVLQGGWAGLALGHVEGNWDGSADHDR